MNGWAGRALCSCVSSYRARGRRVNTCWCNLIVAFDRSVERPGEVERALPNALPIRLRRGKRSQGNAGQLLGTSGYEEAAGLGLLAGINAVAALRGEVPFIPAREDAYLGVLVDDVCGRDHREPYRMFTSRAEHRLLLGVDTARERLMEHGCRLGLVQEAAFHVERARWRRRRAAAAALEGARLTPTETTRKDVFDKAGIVLSAPTTWAAILRRQDVDAESVAATLADLSGLDAEDRRIVIGRLRYDGYLARQERERERLHRLRHVEIPTNLDPSAMPGLSREVAEALGRERPRTLADAERVPGMTPAALALLAGRLARRGRLG